MPAGISPSDRKLLVIGAALLLLMLTASVILAPPQEREGSPIPSTYSTASGGARATYLLLTELHYPVRRWEEPPTELGSSPEDILLVLADPTQPPNQKEREALVTFVRHGGHILFTGSDVRAFFQDAQLSENPDPGWKTLDPTIPSHLSAVAQRVVMKPEAYWGTVEESQLQLYGQATEVAVLSWKVGDGKILWWAGPTPLTNAGITREDNLNFLLSSVLDGSEDIRDIYWDEYFHGQRSSLWSYIQKTSLPWGLLQLGLLAFAVIFSLSRRSGPVYVPEEVSRLSPLEFVDTLAGLYEKAGAASSALAVSYQQLRSLLTRQLSLPAATSDAELVRAASQRFGWKSEDFGPLLTRAETATRDSKLRPREALGLVQQLEAYAARLRVGWHSRQEKN
jgi:hypothetical protein